MKKLIVKTTSCSIACLMLIMQPLFSALAETITIGKGTGILWEGMPFNVTLNGSLDDARLNPVYGLLAITLNSNVCMSSGSLKDIGGYMAYPISGLSGVGLIPRATGVVRYTRNNGNQQILNATLGLPETQGSSPAQNSIQSTTGYDWCLAPQTTSDDYFYSSSGTRTATLSGDWVLVADGTQQTGQGTLPPIYVSSFSRVTSGDRRGQILPTNINLRISTLECSVNTPTAINFGYISRNTVLDAELAMMPVQIVATCGQETNRINANINLQFRAISGLYNNDSSRLALNQGGGYITGEIDGGVTGSGSCGSSTGIRFDNTAIKMGSISSAESSKTLANQLIWRLCSGGSSVPAGAVTASTEMLVTFN